MWEDRDYNRPSSSMGRNFSFLIPRGRLTLFLMVINLVLFFIQIAMQGAQGVDPLGKYGALTFADGYAWKQPWRWITYMYLHGGGQHIFFNLITMYFFVPFLEERWGWKRTLLFYTGGGIAGGITFGIVSQIFGFDGYLVGASGALLAVIGAIAAIAPEMQVLLIVIPMTMRVLATLYAMLYMLTILGDRNLSDACHLGGLVFGVFAVYLGAPFRRKFEDKWETARADRVERSKKHEQEELDRILDKVHHSGMNSLTWSERRFLKQATERQRKRDAADERRIKSI